MNVFRATECRIQQLSWDRIPRILRAGPLLALILWSVFPILSQNRRAAKDEIPSFQIDPYWPKPLPNKWMLGQVSGIFVDAEDHIWVTNRPRTLDNNDKYASLAPPQADCCAPAPPVLEFDEAGNFLSGWGGPGPRYEWPDNEHGIFVDYKQNVWIGGNAPGKDTNILKFTAAGKFLLQIGHHGITGGSNDTENLNRPAGIFVYEKTNEVFVADGYGNRRIIVFDADTGKYKRHWGAYGNKPDDSAPHTRLFSGPGPKQFDTVHSVRISNDDLVYVADRVNNRIQVFKPDGNFVKEGFIERGTSAPEGTAFDLAFSPDKQQQYLYVADGSNKKVHILKRETLEVVGFFGGFGGRGTGQFFHLHSMATDSKGNVFIGESLGMRVQKWIHK
jgi:DNA-binding beta-propeller fold protein YncE